MVGATERTGSTATGYRLSLMSPGRRRRMSRLAWLKPGKGPLGAWLAARTRVRSNAVEKATAGSRAHHTDFPFVCLQWYDDLMNGTHRVTMGDRGRLVIPAVLRERA